MKTTITNLNISRSIKIALLAALTAIVAVPFAVQAWGPSRATYTIASPASEVVFNSITDNPHVGDERNFVVARDASITTDGQWSDNVTIQNGKEYTVRVYVHNNANANLNLKAINTRVAAGVSSDGGKTAGVSAFVSADNANPTKVWDDVKFSSDKHFKLTYVPGSAEIYNNGYAAGGQGKSLPDAILSANGTRIGYEKAGDGIIPGCFEYDNFIYFKVLATEVPEPNFTVEKKVRLNGETDWVTTNIKANPGDTVNYQIGYKNTGNTTQNNVIVKDTLPEGVTYIQDSTTLKNANYPTGDGTKVQSNAVVRAGLDIGGYTPGSNAFVRFSATMPTNDQLTVCGDNTIRNIVNVTTDNGTKQDVVDVIVTKTDCGTTQQECKPGVPVGDPRCDECAPNANGELPAECIVSELPKTGPAETIMTMIAIATLATVASYIIKRNRALKADHAVEAEVDQNIHTDHQ